MPKLRLFQRCETPECEDDGSTSSESFSGSSDSLNDTMTSGKNDMELDVIIPTERRPNRTDKYPVAEWIRKHAGLTSMNIAPLSELLTDQSVYDRFERCRAPKTWKIRQQNRVEKSTAKTCHEMPHRPSSVNNSRVVVQKTTASDQNRRCTETKYSVGTKRNSLVSNRNRRPTEQSMTGYHRTATDVKSPIKRASGRCLSPRNSQEQASNDDQLMADKQVTTGKNSLSPRDNKKSVATHKYDAEMPTASERPFTAACIYPGGR